MGKPYDFWITLLLVDTIQKQDVGDGLGYEKTMPLVVPSGTHRR